jgi:amino acid transporter
MVSSIGAVLGTVFPGCVIIGLGFVWFFQGRPLQIGSHWIPDLSNFDQLTLLAGVFLSFAGIEMSAIHARSVDNPQKSYPKAIFLSALLIAVISTLGTLTIASVIPKNELSLVSGGLDAFTLFLSAYGLEKAIPIAAGLIAIGAFSQMSTWIAGPSLGLLAASQTGEWPEALRKKNRYGMPAKMMLCQAVIVSILSLIFLYLPSLSSSFWLLIVLTAQFYLLLYILMFSAAIWLRIKKPEVERVYRVPGGKWGMFLVAGVGIGSSSFAFLMGFIPPDQWANGQTFFYVAFLVVGVLVGTAVPSILSWIAKRQRRFDAFKI